MSAILDYNGSLIKLAHPWQCLNENVCFLNQFFHVETVQVVQVVQTLQIVEVVETVEVVEIVEIVEVVDWSNRQTVNASLTHSYPFD